MDFPVSATFGRPAFLPSPLAFSHNNLFPEARVEGDVLVVRVVLATRIPIREIESIERSKRLFTSFVDVRHRGWVYALGFRNDEDAERCRAALAEARATAGS